MLWHPFADMAKVPGNEVCIERGEGCWVWDDCGRGYLDASAGLWFCNVGHGREELAEAAAWQMRKLGAYHLFDVFSNAPAERLAERICDLAPTGPGSAVFFTPGGSEGVETAMKLVRRYWTELGQPERRLVVARDHGYHGMSAYGTSLGGIGVNATGWGTLVGDVLRVAFDDDEALRALLAEHGERIAAVIGEPVIGAGGVRPAPAGYWPAVSDACEEHGVLLIMDEVVCGFGRLGEWFGSTAVGARPDVVITAKGLTSGYAPLGAVVLGDRIRATLAAPGTGPIRHGYTYSGHATACAVALANLDVIEREGLVERVSGLAPVLRRELEPLLSHTLVGEIRTAGLLAGVELDAAALRADPGLVDRAVVLARRHGLIVRGLVGRTLQISPPFTITEDELRYVADRLLRVLNELVARPAAVASA